MINMTSDDNPFTYMGMFNSNFTEILPTLPLNIISRINMAFGDITPTTNGQFEIGFDFQEPNFTGLVGRINEVNPNIELFLTISGKKSSTSFGGASKDKNFGGTVSQFLKENGIIGFDIDWEVDISKTDVTNLLDNVSSALHTNGQKLTFVTDLDVQSGYPIDVMAEKLDQINMMTYGPNINLDTIVNNYKNAGMPVTKMIAGIESEIGFWDGGPDTLGENGSIAAKASAAKQLGLYGTMSYRLDNDYDVDNMPTFKAANALYTYMTGN